MVLKMNKIILICLILVIYFLTFVDLTCDCPFHDYSA